MDRYIIENFFLKVGRSYYKSSEFLQTRSLLRKKGLDFTPVAEFGIGVMAVFMLGDRIEVETSPWSLTRKDGHLRRLSIDGVARLIEVKETDNSGPGRFYGTRVTVRLSSKKAAAPTWAELKQYIQDVCKNLDFILTLEHVTADGTEIVEVHPEGLIVPVPSYLSESALHIPVEDAALGLKGEIVFYRSPESAPVQAALANETPLHLMDRPKERRMYGRTGILLRGGFAVGGVPALPSLTPEVDARVEVTRSVQNARSLPETDLGRSRLTEQKELEASIFKTWLSALLSRIEDIEDRPIGDPGVQTELFRSAKWLEVHSAFDLFRLAKSAWPFHFADPANARKLLPDWEGGRGPSIWVGDTYPRSMAAVLFGMILPKVTSIVVGADGNYFARPPSAGWQDALREWHSFVVDDMSWPVFVEYLPPLSGWLLDCYSGMNFLNKKFEKCFDGFEISEAKSLPSLLEKLVAARSVYRQIQFEDTQIDLLMRLSDVAGNLTIRRYGTSYKIIDLIEGSGRPSKMTDVPAPDG